MSRIGDAFPSQFLKASDLKGATVAVTIREVKTEQVGRDKEWKPVVYFEGKEKGVVLNRTNARKIVELAGTDETNDWPGVTVALFATMVEFSGEQVEAIRIKAPMRAAAKRAEPPPPPHDVDEDEIPF